MADTVFRATTPANGEIHVWSLDLDLPRAELASFWSCLSSAERTRAQRFRFDRDRNRFVAGRGWLRRLLAPCLDLRPAELEFEYGPFGKPTLASLPGSPVVHFNLAHSENRGLLAVTTAGPVGVDLEAIRLLPEFEALVDRFFSPRESALFGGLSAEARPAAFFRLWTRKEAWLKATGDGIGQFLNQVEVSFLEGEAARLLRLPDAYSSDQTWTLIDLQVGHGFAAALAVGANQALGNVRVRLCPAPEPCFQHHRQTLIAT